MPEMLGNQTLISLTLSFKDLTANLAELSVWGHFQTLLALAFLPSLLYNHLVSHFKLQAKSTFTHACMHLWWV